MRSKYILSVLLVLSQIGCKEDYNPIIDSHLNAIVVEGLITNLKESYKVKISMSNPYDSVSNSTGVLGISVSIKDDLGNTYLMHEDNQRRNYYSDTSEFIAVPGRSYKLLIKMPDGDLYESSYQMLTPPPNLDSIYGNVTNKEYLYTNQLGELTTKMAYGSETFLDLSYNSDSIMQFRFDNTLMKCYTYWYWYTPEMKQYGVPFPPPNPCLGPACPYMIYNWKKFNANTGMNLTITTHNLRSNLMKNNSVCFFPFDNSFYPILIKKDSCGKDPNGIMTCFTIKGPSGIEGTLFETKTYALNKESSVYYNQANDQLSATGKLFDPIAVQIKGNIKCTSNPNKLALGLFEVSACTKRSYWLIFNYQAGYTIYQPIANISNIPDSGAGKEPPDFWLKIFNQ
jgi:hypothetical protein